MAGKVSASDNLIILGVDPGLANLGWGVVQKRGSKCLPVAYGCITTSAAEETIMRLEHIYDEILGVIDRYKPAELGVEAIFFGNNAKSALSTGQALGAVMIAAAKNQIGVSEYSPTQVKQVLVGQGRAEKPQVQYMVKHFLGLDHEPAPNHAADALAVAICHARMRSML